MSRRSDGLPAGVLPLFEIVHTARLADRAFADTFARRGLAAGEFGVLASVNDEPGLTQAEVARRLHVRPQTIARPVASLIRAGLVGSAEPRRRGVSGRLHITPEGRRRLDDTWPDVAVINHPKELGLTDREADELVRLLGRVRERLLDEEGAGRQLHHPSPGWS